MQVSRITGLFPLWALLGALLAWLRPELFIPLKPTIVPMLGVVMFGMGITLTTNNFLAVLQRPLQSRCAAACRQELRCITSQSGEKGPQFSPPAAARLCGGYPASRCGAIALRRTAAGRYEIHESLELPPCTISPPWLPI